MMDGERRGVTLLKRNGLGPALHARPLFSQDEFAASETRPRLRKQDRDLNRKDKIAVKILVEAVIVTRHILQQQRCRARLTGIVASREK
jgi:hypothetical protein